MLGKDAVNPNVPPAPTFQRDVNVMDKQTLAQYGVVHVLKTHVEHALRKGSPRKGILVYFFERGNEYDIVKLPRRSSDEEAEDTAKKLDKLAKGIVVTPTGYAIRVKKEDVGRARTLLDPDFAAAVGDKMRGGSLKTTTVV